VSVSVRKKKRCRPAGAGDEPDSRIGPGQRSWESESTQRVSVLYTYTCKPKCPATTTTTVSLHYLLGGGCSAA